MDLTETLLPGVGVRYELTTRSGQRLGIIVQRQGAAELAVYDRADPDKASLVLQLAPDEVEAVADILGAPRMTQHFADLSREVPGLRSGRLAIRAGSAYDGRLLGDTKARTLTGCSIVAVVRDRDVVTSPEPDEVLHGGDVLVVIGSAHGLEQLKALLSAPSAGS